MSDLQVVGLGMAVLDILIRLKEMPNWQQGGRLSAVAIEGGGPVATAMVAVSRLGMRAGFVGVCGSDRAGDIKMQTLVENDLDVRRVVRRSDPEREVVLVCVHTDTGERVFVGPEHGGYTPLTMKELDREYIVSAEYLHLDGHHAEAALQAARWMHEEGKTVVLDGSSTRAPVPPQMRALVEACDILICGSGFGPALTGHKDLWAVGESILEMGPRIVVQTEGKDGSYTVTPEERFHTPSFDVEVIDTTGAGDVFHGAYIVGQLRGWDPRRSALFATAVSAVKCTKLSGRAGIPNFDDTLAFLRQRGHEIC